MKRLLIILGCIAGVVVLALLAGIYYIASFDPNAHKQSIAQKFHSATGRELHLDGNIGLTLYPWLGLSVDQLSVDNAPGFSKEPLLTVAHAQLRLKLMSLIHNEIEIDTVRISGVRANLEVAANGSNNWTFESSNEANAPAADPQNNSSSKKLLIGGVDIHDTRVVYDNLATNAHYDLSNLDLAIGELSYGQPLVISANLHAASRKPDLQAELKLAGTVVYDVEQGLYQLDPFTINTTLTGPTVPGGSTAISFATAVHFDSNKNSLTLPQLELAALDTRVSGKLALADMSSGTPSLNTELHASSKDVSVFFRIFGQDELATRLRALDNKLELNVSIDANLQSGEVKIPAVQASVLGFTLNGSVNGSNLRDGKGDVAGTFSLKNDNLHELMTAFDQQGIAASLQTLAVNATISGNSTALQLSPLTMKLEFAGNAPQQLLLTADTQVNLDQSSLSVKQLSLKGAGLNVSGELSAKDLATKLSYAGKLSLPTTNIRQVLQQLQVTAPNFSDATTLQKVSAQADFSGTTTSFNLQQVAV